jgi:acyl-CoA reductase-like NAD-dependent aldehyde dehydrogenase
MEQQEFLIGGRWAAPATTGTITVRSAATWEIIGSAPEGSEADIDAAVSAARDAFDDPHGWSHWSHSARADALGRLATALEERSEEMARRVTMQNGMPILFATVIEGAGPAALLRHDAAVLRATPEEEVRELPFGGNAVVGRKALGVVGAIVPWNAPQLISSMKYSPALAAGCTVVMKPSPETVLDAFLLAEAVIDADLPPGVLNIVPGGRDLGAYLVTHPDVDKISFTGSTAAGRAIGETCGRLLRPVTLELGGKSAAIVLDDANLGLPTVSADLFGATMANNGQACFLGTRVLAPATRYEEVVEAFSAIARTASVGDPLDPDVQVGPLASERQRDRVEGYIAVGSSEGARLVAGGGRPEDLERGWFVRPTVFADVDNRSRIAQEEIFGPVLSIIRYDGDDEAVRIANDSDYGLGGSVWSAHEDRALAVARQVQTGTIGVNHYAPNMGAPFGGVKASGQGREYSPEAVSHYQSLQTIYRR